MPVRRTATPSSKVTAKGKPLAASKPRATTTAEKKRRPRSVDPAGIPPSFHPVATAFAAARGVSLEPGWGKDNIALKRGGKIFAMLVRGDLVAKLPSERVEALVEGGLASRFDPRRNGRVMKEWAVVPPAHARRWTELAQEAHAFLARRP
jgi:hypothetical protein